MSILDQNEQQMAAAASAAASAALAGATPLTVRSLSAPHYLFSGLPPQDYYYSGRLPPHPINQGYLPSAGPYAGYPLDQSPLGQMSYTSTYQYNACQPSFNSITPTTNAAATLQPTQGLGQDNFANNGSNFNMQNNIHPFQMDQLTNSISDLEAATGTRVKQEFQHGQYIMHPLDDIHGRDSPLSYSPTTSPIDTTTPPLGHQMKTTPSLRATRGYSWSLYDSGVSHFDVTEGYPAHSYARHGSVGSLYPLTQSHELSEPYHNTTIPRHFESTPMIATDSSTSITSMTSNNSTSTTSSSSSSSPPPSNSKPRSRRASLNPDISSRVFTCEVEECGRIFKRSEHLKRHVRSVHTLEKPFGCPFMSCPKRFSRSDNLNQHIRIHRYERENVQPRRSSSFTPLQVPLD